MRPEHVNSTTPRISDEESLARFVRFSGDVIEGVNKEKRLRLERLVPNRPPYVVSVYREDMMNPEELDAAKQRVMKNSGKSSIYGILHLTRSMILQAQLESGECLDVEPEESEFRWHADIVGWPSGPDPLIIEKREQLATELLKHAGPVDVADT